MQGKESERLQRLVKEATRPDKGKWHSWEEGTEAWDEWERTHSRETTRARAIEEIKCLGPVAVDVAVTTFIQILDERHDVKYDPGARCAVIDAMGKMGDARLVQPLIEELEWSGEYESDVAVDALAMIGRPAVEPLLQLLAEEDISLYSYGSGSTIRRIIQTLGKIGDQRTLEPLIQICKYAEPDRYKRELYDYTFEALSRIDRRPRTWLEKLMKRRPWAP